VPDLPLRRFCAVFDFREELGLDPNALAGYPLDVRLRLLDQRLQPVLQVRRRPLVEAVVDLAGVDEGVALAPADVEPVPLASVKPETCNRQGLTLRTRLLTQSLLRPAG
jgi:hypothetical protein